MKPPLVEGAGLHNRVRPRSPPVTTLRTEGLSYGAA